MLFNRVAKFFRAYNKNVIYQLLLNNDHTYGDYTLPYGRKHTHRHNQSIHHTTRVGSYFYNFRNICTHTPRILGNYLLILLHNHCTQFLLQ